MNTKTLAVIINHNGRAYTNQLYKSLKPYEQSGNYDLVVLDNGSTRKEEISEFTAYAVEENTYYGGAVNLIFTLMHEEQQYDSVLILNNDIILHPYNFVKVMRSAMFDGGYAVVSPSVLQPEESQCHWKQMHNWSSPLPRNVKWVDFMCPMIHRKVIEEIKQFSHTLKYGWGQDVYTGVVCQRMGWSTAVLDTNTVIHLSSQTYKDAKSDITLSDYAIRASNGMYEYFQTEGLMPIFESIRNECANYKWEGNV